MTIRGKIRQLQVVMGDARWWPFYLQRRFMGVAIRGRISAAVAKRLRPEAGATFGPHTSASSFDPAGKLAALQCDGIAHLGSMLSASQAGELQDYFLAKPVTDPYRPERGPFLPAAAQRHAECHVAYHEARDVVRAPYLLSIANHPDILAVVSGFLGCRPTLGYLAAWWSYPTTVGAQQAELFHRDVDDWRFVKLFIYLTDVGAVNGPHVYVRQLSCGPALRHIRRLDDDEVLKAYGRDRVMHITGRAGEGFLEDTFGIHKGQPVTTGRRLIFQAVYSMYALPYGPRSPVASLAEIAQPGGIAPDPWINRLYLKTQ